MEIFPSCCVCNVTFRRSRGCVIHAAPAEANPPKYQRANFGLSLDISIKKKICELYEIQPSSDYLIQL